MKFFTSNRDNNTVLYLSFKLFIDFKMALKLVNNILYNILYKDVVYVHV